MRQEPSFIDPVQASLRESRMVLERLVQWSGVEPGMIFSVMDCGLYSAAQGLSGFEGLRGQLRRLDCARHPPLRLIEAGADLQVDAGGRHAWLVAEPCLDLAVDAYRRHGRGMVHVRDVDQPGELAVVSSIAGKYGLHASVGFLDNDVVEMTVGPATPGIPSMLDRIRRNGIPVRRELWFELLALSSNALAEDTVISRTHTGSFIVRPDGSVEGAEDAEFAQDDLSMLTVDRLAHRR